MAAAELPIPKTRKIGTDIRSSAMDERIARLYIS
jgi:hypothetical protein